MQKIKKKAEIGMKSQKNLELLNQAARLIITVIERANIEEEDKCQRIEEIRGRLTLTINDGGSGNTGASP